jgi:hypothetical protein
MINEKAAHFQTDLIVIVFFAVVFAATEHLYLFL